MTSLTEVYEGGTGAGLRRLYVGVALFAVGAVLLTTGIVMASTDIGEHVGLGLYDAREVAGILGGIGFPAVLIGTMTVLPKASRDLRLGAGTGAAICLIAVAMFRHWYPVDWMGGTGNTTMTLVVAGTYFTGAIIATWCLFTAVANFKARNDPGGTVKLEITKGGKTRVVEVSSDNLRGRLSGIGLLGGTPDGDVATQTNRATSTRSTRSTASSATTSTASTSVTDGGASTASQMSTPGSSRSDDAELLDEDPVSVGDPYCGNCTHFRYVRTDDGMVPYCGLHSEMMEDMEACDEWTPNTSS